MTAFLDEYQGARRARTDAVTEANVSIITTGSTAIALERNMKAILVMMNVSWQF